MYEIKENDIFMNIQCLYIGIHLNKKNKYIYGFAFMYIEIEDNFNTVEY